MFPKAIFFITFLFLTLQLSAQKNKGTIEGFVLDAVSNKPIDYATISVFNKTDSTLVSGGISEESGKFSIKVPYGIFFLEVRFLSYQTHSIPLIDVHKKNKTHTVGNIGLIQSTTALSEVEVLAEKGTVQLNLDKRVYNVGSDIISSGGSALEVLDNVPSVTVDPNGKVNIRGNGNVQMLINGKPSALVAGSEGLKRLQSSMITSVEVITNPSAKYQAEGAAGIINIILKKNKDKGINGSLSTTVGFPTNLGFSADLNYRKNDLNFFINYNISYRDRPGQRYFDHQFENNGVLELSDMQFDLDNNDFVNAITGGVDYYFNEKNILTGSIYFDKTIRDYFGDGRYQDFLEDKNNLIRTTNRTDDQDADLDWLEYALTYKKLFEQKGHSIEFDVRLQDDEERRTNTFIDKIKEDLAESEVQQRANNIEAGSKWIASIDYTFPFKKGGNLEAGYQSSWRKINNDYLVEQLNGTTWETYQGLDNELDYKENIHALYSTYANKIEKLSYQIGLRVEQSDISTTLLRTNDFNPRENIQLFPSGHISYALANDNAVKLSYSRRIRRPGFWELNPFFTLLDSRNFLSGNPNLNPALTDSYELSHIKYWENISLSTAIYYKDIANKFAGIQVVDEQGRTSSMPENLNYQKDYGLELTGSWKPSSKFSMNSNINFIQQKIDGSNIDSDFLASGFTWTGRISPKIKIQKNWNFQARLNYRGKRPSVQGTRLAYAYMDIGLNRFILNKKGRLTFNVSDVFNSKKINQIAYLGDLTRESGYQYYRRSINLNFRYKL